MIEIIVIYLVGYVVAYALLSRAVINGLKLDEWDNSYRGLTCFCSLGSWLTAIASGLACILQIIMNKRNWKFFKHFIVPLLRKIEPKKRFDGIEVKDIT